MAEEAENAQFEVLGVDSEQADVVMSALSSDTAKDIFLQLQDTPSTTSELADDLECSVQNVHHHIHKLRDAELVQVRHTFQSSKGTERQVYEASDTDILILSGSEERAKNLKKALKRALVAGRVLEG